jgi:hypothetical protein
MSKRNVTIVASPTFVPALVLIAESLFSASSAYFIEANHRIISFKVRARVKGDHCKTNPIDDLCQNAPEEIFDGEVSDEDRYAYFSQTIQTNHQKTWKRPNRTNGIELIQQFYIDEYPNFDLYFTSILTEWTEPYGPDGKFNRIGWTRQPGLSKEELKAQGIHTKDQPFILRLSTINGKKFHTFTERERFAMTGRLNDSKCELLPPKDPEFIAKDIWDTGCGNLTKIR